MTIAAVVSDEQRWHVEHGEAGEVLRLMPDACVDAIVTDPPAGIAFMGKTWDHDHGGREGWVRAFASIFRECLRVLKPGGRAFVWSIPRTSHWTACAVEDAGFVIENTVAHVFGSGFPKGKGQLKPAREDWILCRKPGGKVQPLGIDACRVAATGERLGGGGESRATNAHRDGWGRPWMEDPGHVAAHTTKVKANVEHASRAGRWPPNLLLSHSPGCVRVGDKRVPTGIAFEPTGQRHQLVAGAPSISLGRIVTHADADGLETVADWRCQDGCPVKLMGEQSGERPSGSGEKSRRTSTTWGGGPLRPVDGESTGGDTGTAARFFPQFEPDPPPFYYAAKASRRERNAGCEGLPERIVRVAVEAHSGNPSAKSGERVDIPRANVHPTVKPQALMRWLIRLITPPGGVVLDCFAGSGSTIVAAITEGCRAIGVEREVEYVTIAKARAEYAAKQGPLVDRAPHRAGKPVTTTPAPQRQLGLFG